MDWECASYVAQVVETVLVAIGIVGALIGLGLQARATGAQATDTFNQTILSIYSLVQAEEMRKTRGMLFEIEDRCKISAMKIEKWKREWEQAADRVSQAYSIAAAIAKQDPKLKEIWIKPERRSILKSWKIAQPRIQDRRDKQQKDLWEDFEWLANEAKVFSEQGKDII